MNNGNQNQRRKRINLTDGGGRRPEGIIQERGQCLPLFHVQIGGRWVTDLPPSHNSGGKEPQGLGEVTKRALMRARGIFGKSLLFAILTAFGYQMREIPGEMIRRENRRQSVKMRTRSAKQILYTESGSGLRASRDPRRRGKPVTIGKETHKK